MIGIEIVGMILRFLRAGIQIDRDIRSSADDAHTHLRTLRQETMGCPICCAVVVNPNCYERLAFDER
jgi:hypothetical protein